VAKQAKKVPSQSEEKFEVLLARLEEIVKKLEEGDLDLEEALAAFEQGVNLSRHLNKRLREAQEQVEILLKNAQGQLEAVPLDESGQTEDAEV